MKRLNIELTDRQAEFILRAVDYAWDYENDTALDDLDIYPNRLQTIVIDRAKAMEIRNEIDNVLNAILEFSEARNKIRQALRSGG